MKPEFFDWLKSTKKLTQQSAYDVVSRLRRVEGFCSPYSELNITLFRLNKSKNFAKLTVSVRSQLRRAVKLHHEYIAESSS